MAFNQIQLSEIITHFRDSVCKMLASLRQHRRSLATTLVVVFSAGWLSLAAAPCFADVMSTGKADQAAPEMMMVTMGEHCPHCDEAEMPCGQGEAATAAMTCDGQATLPTHFFDLKKQFVAVVPTPLLQSVYASVSIVRCPAVVLAIPPPDIPATERFCSYHE